MLLIPNFKSYAPLKQRSKCSFDGGRVIKLTPNATTIEIGNATTNGSTTFRLRCSDSSIDLATVTAYEADRSATAVTPALVFDKTAVDIPAGGTANVLVRFSSAPASNVAVTVARESGDADISVAAGSNLTFTPANWNTYQTVTLAAAGTNADPASTATIWPSARPSFRCWTNCCDSTLNIYTAIPRSRRKRTKYIDFMRTCSIVS